MSLKYKQLKRKQKAYICNGCGAKGGWIKPPDFLFLASCNHHDFKFWLGASEEDFNTANDDFYMWMKVDIENAKWYLKPFYHLWAFIYYKAVCKYGKKYFNFSDKQKTIHDLNREIMDFKRGKNALQ